MPNNSGSGNAADLIRMAIATIDEQIKELSGQREQLARLVAGGAIASTAAAGRRGRPPGKPAKAAKVAAAPGKKRKRRKFSAETKRKLSEAAKARWARERGEI